MYWIDLVPVRKRSVDVEDMYLSQLTAVERRVGEVVMLLGRRWKVVSCYAA